MSFFTDNPDAKDLSWVDTQVQEELMQAMIVGVFDNVDPAIAYIQYIPPNLELTTASDLGEDPNANNAAFEDKEPDNTELASPHTFAWILGSFGIMGVIVAFYVIYKKRRKNLNDSVDFSSVRGSPKKGSFPVLEIIDDNSEFDHDEIYKDDEEHDSHVIVAKPPSWRQVREPRNEEEFLRLQINATDPNQPVVKPVLDEEAETYISNV